ncbi:hypothetical protein A8713_23425 [Streptomyces sp. SAT1]|uniref:hypothetical protein n=1 Tax=Streptomyces sp. SAT1 TaxID=1849967 RepID=UPI0007DE2B2D|nr:hypothetical protein [Streptomyces sp. SAT1]ANH95625.1 hypothetical protein A8713_23425 [Streptomyces sp. SAT1]
MTGRPERPEPTPARTDFESMTHEQLATLLDSATTAGASHLAARLSKAASTITKIGSDLMDHVKSLEWQGEGGDAFRDWGGQTASSTLRLGQYAEVASRWMGTVSQAIAEAKAAMPDTSETARAKTDLADAHKTITALQQPGVHNDPDAQQAARTARSDATAAQHRIDAARHEAIQQLRKLAQTYEYSAQQVNGVQPPTFPPPAENTGSPDWWRGDKTHASGSSEQTGAALPASHHVARSGAAGPHPMTPVGSSAVTGQSPSGPEQHLGQQHQPVSLDIDGLDTLPRQTQPPAPPATAETNVPHQGPPITATPPPLPPAFTGGGRGPAPVPPSRASAPGRSPQGPLVSRPAGNTPRTPQGPGIVGGRPVPEAGRSASRLPQGTVIGRENTQGRVPMGRGISPGVPADGSGRSGTGSVGGRRLASETGGLIGNRPGQPVRGSGRPFTAGGSGLVRPSANASEAARGSAVGGTTSGSRSSKPRKEQQPNGRRPDYLAEDEETWTRDRQRPLPPVID